MPRADISVVRATPVLTVEQFESFTTRCDAIVLIAFATGTAPQSLISAAKEKINSGIPIFLLSDNSGDDHGILKMTYENQFKWAEVGAISLEKVNVNNVSEVVNAINEEFTSGKRGQELGAAIEQRFKYGEQEVKPKAEWEQ